MPRKPFRDEQVHIQAAKCSTCIFRPGNLMHLAPGRVDEMVAQCLDEDTAIVCHDTLDGDQALCRGFVDVYGREVLPVRLAYVMGVVCETPTPS